jgi:hypothetical protein
MKEMISVFATRFFTVLVALLMFAPHTAWADDGVQHIAFRETFDSTEGTGGHDGGADGNVGQSKIVFDQDGWTTTKCGGAKYCVRFGTSDKDGVLTTPPIILLGKTGEIFFDAVGWNIGKRELRVTANEGVTLSGDTYIPQLPDQCMWHHRYCVSFTLETADYLQITFTGRRGFIDEIEVTETVTAINAPTLTEEHLFWPNTTEEATTNVTLIPSDSTTVYYTTDGSEPTPDNGHIATLTSNFKVTGTTTVKARAYYTGYYYGEKRVIASDLVTKTYTEGMSVRTIAAFNEKDDGDEVCLFIPYYSEARLLHGQDGKAYLYDNTGPLCLDFGSTATFNPAPQHNQHVAGWIVGKKQTVDGLHKLVATSNTNTSHLVLAAPVTEAATTPITIDETTELNTHIGNWVKAEDLRDGAFNINGSYDGALVDVSGIVTANNTITPMEIDNIAPLVFVIDEDKDFTSPSANIENATVRLKRTLTANQWNTFCVPFDIANLNGNIREYDEIDGTTMKFTNSCNIEAGTPYLVKPNSDIENPVYSNVTLFAQAAKSIEIGGYSFIGTYSPKELATDKTELFLTNSGKLAYPSSTATATMKGMRAYFKVPAGADARLNIDDMEDGITPISTVGEESNAWYDLTGRRIANGPLGRRTLATNGTKEQPTAKGIYIQNGKKQIIK